MNIFVSLKAKSDKEGTIQKALRNSGWLFIERILKLVISLFVSVAVARYLRPENFGYLNYALSFLTLFLTLSSLGMDNIIIRNLTDNPKEKDKILGTSFIIKLSASIILTIILIITAYLYSLNKVTFILLLVMAPVLILNTFQIIDLSYQAQTNSKLAVVVRTIVFFITSLLKVLVIVFKGSLVMIASITMIETLLIAIGFLYLYKKQGLYITKWKWSNEYGKNIIRDSWPLLFSSFAIVIYMKIDQIMLGDMVGAKETGVYSVAVRLAELWYFIPTVIVPSFFPYLNKLKDKEEKFSEKFQTLFDLMVFLGLLIAIPTTFISPFIIKILYGPEYSGASIILSLYIWIGVFVNLGVARSAYLNIKNWPYIHLLSSGIGCLINILLNLYLIPKYGAVGATVASMISYWFQAHGICFFIPKMHRNSIQMTKSLLVLFRFKDFLAALRRNYRNEDSIL